MFRQLANIFIEKDGAQMAGGAGVQPVAATFRRILVVVSLMFVFAIVQMLMLRAVCDAGMATAASLENQGLPALNKLASLQEHLALYRLNSYEYLFAHEAERAALVKAVEALATKIRAELHDLQQLVPDGDGSRLVAALRAAVDELDAEFIKVRGLVDTDFSEAMNAMDRGIPPKTERVAAAAGALKDYGYRFSGGQANATFGSFGGIKKNAVMFGLGNIAVAFGAVMFVVLAARRSRAQLSETLARLGEQTSKVTGSLSMLNATLESTTDGILVVDSDNQPRIFNRIFAEMWRLPRELLAGGGGGRRALLLAAVQVKDSRAFLKREVERQNLQCGDTFDVLELKDGRVFERYSQPQRIDGVIVGRVWCCRDITERRRAETKLADTHRQLIDMSRQAGMAEVATGVLHNVGNVLNSVNVSATLAADHVRHSKTASVAKLAALFDEHRADLALFLTQDPKGRMVPGYLATLRDSLADEQKTIIAELNHLRKNVEHIKEIVAMQQNYAKASGFIETVPLAELVEDVLRMNAGSLLRHEVEVVRDFQIRPAVTTDKHKVIQVLVNLVRNAKHACSASSRGDKRIIVRLTGDGKRVCVSVVDNGVGIPPENLSRIFNHGFTTKKNGHGFGLHSGALAAKELGGSLTVQSDGPGLGATFAFELPCNSNVATHEHSVR